MRLRDRPKRKEVGFARLMAAEPSGAQHFQGYSPGGRPVRKPGLAECPWAGPLQALGLGTRVQASGPGPQCVSGPTGHHLGAAAGHTGGHAGLWPGPLPGVLEPPPPPSDARAAHGKARSGLGPSAPRDEGTENKHEPSAARVCSRDRAGLSRHGVTPTQRACSHRTSPRFLIGNGFWQKVHDASRNIKYLESHRSLDFCPFSRGAQSQRRTWLMRLRCPGGVPAQRNPEKGENSASN